MERIITSTGFCIPKNQYFTPFTQDNVISDEIFNRSLVISSDYTLAKYFRDNDIYTSTTVNKVYSDYRSNPTYDNFMLMVDLTSEIFKDCNFLDFISWQISNPHASASSLMFCTDLVMGKLGGLSIYGNIPYSSRFCVNEGLTTEKVRTGMDKMVKRKSDLLRNNNFHADEGVTTWVELFSRLIINRNDFMSFYKYVLCDYY